MRNRATRVVIVLLSYVVVAVVLDLPPSDHVPSVHGVFDLSDAPYDDD